MSFKSLTNCNYQKKFEVRLDIVHFVEWQGIYFVKRIYTSISCITDNCSMIYQSNNGSLGTFLVVLAGQISTRAMTLLRVLNSEVAATLSPQLSYLAWNLPHIGHTMLQLLPSDMIINTFRFNLFFIIGNNMGHWITRSGWNIDEVRFQNLTQ